MKAADISLPHPLAETSRRTAIFLAEMEGQAAGQAGEAASANPYERRSVERFQWLAGWIETARRSRKKPH